MNKLLRNTLITLGLTVGSLAAAQTPLAFRSVVRVGNELSLAINETWSTMTERGYSGSVIGMTGNSVGYRFTLGDEIVEVTLRQTDRGVLAITKDSHTVVLASR